MSYIKICLKGKTIRFKKHINDYYSKELLILNSKVEKEAFEILELLPDESIQDFFYCFSKEILHKFLKNILSTREHKVITLTVIENRTDESVGGSLNISRSTVSRVRKKALNKIKINLKKGGMFCG
ncbi:hypothetical protein IMX26_02035 [Clostridium sp. 'deep sea']|uniref:sigma factor-like helix-turn-helix DNA-binding protein n=1 Tax=Clostridium sp. 'deep sea' TaxID=2779445 RepID=UPI001896717D|nr:sigma factor-like helix-turn-helix DNA-binding protein [Clostridium sp. 'deep sea']QOR35631.1 hypothetical protein IMX26_02035 [Clostridium sp. 'deep sea']